MHEFEKKSSLIRPKERASYNKPTQFLKGPGKEEKKIITHPKWHCGTQSHLCT